MSSTPQPQRLAPAGGSLSDVSASTKRATRVITYAWGEKYVDTLLTLTLPALLAPGNLPYVAGNVPCELIILTERRFFSKFRRHSTMARIEKVCPVRLVKLDDLIVSKDKYGMTLTYALHRGFSDLGQQMTEHWQIFLNADFILADGSLRSVVGQLARGERIVAAPSYCTIAEDVAPLLRKRVDPATSILSVPPREFARLVLQNRHAVIEGKTVNKPAFHLRYVDQFYWLVDDDTLIGFQMPVSIVGLRPERYVAEPNSYWDYGLIREYCPHADVCVIGDSDDFMMLELREKNVAQDQIVPGPPSKKAIAQQMATWVTPYQQCFLKYPLTLHDRDLPPHIDAAWAKLRLFVDEVMANAPPFPSHVKHSQWEYHWPNFQEARRPSKRILLPLKVSLRNAIIKAKLVVCSFQRAIERVLKGTRRVVLDAFIRPALFLFGAELVRSSALLQKYNEIEELQTQLDAAKGSIERLEGKLTDLGKIAAEYQYKLERSYNYQALMGEDQLRLGMSNLEPEFVTLYEECQEYTMTSWERLYALYKAVQYITDNRIPGDVVECGVWRGGSMKLVAQVLLARGDTSRTLFLYDTFEGMTEPNATLDVDFSGNPAVNDWTEIQRRGVKWSYAPVEEVHNVMEMSGYPMDKVKFVKGPVEDTIPATIPASIALLRLDTDWYSSTKHEMEYLYPILSPQGVLILDDYGHYQGACRGVDEYLSKVDDKPLLQRVDYACRLAIKPVT